MWKSLIYQGKSYEDRFEISDDGKLRNIITGTIYKLNKVGKVGSAYLGVCVSLGSKNNKLVIKIHKAIAETFIPNPNNLPQVNHKDGNKLNNNVSNLEWVTNQENSIHAWQTGLTISKKGIDKIESKLTNENVAYIKENYIPKDKIFGCRALAKQFNVSHSIISKIINKKIWVHLN
jgi:hypothetical protein